MFLYFIKQEGEELKYDKLWEKLGVLARYNLNGRQIRNILNTARQLARYKKESLTYTHVDQAIEVAKEFEEYITQMQGHTDEEYARAQG